MLDTGRGQRSAGDVGMFGAVGLGPRQRDRPAKRIHRGRRQIWGAGGSLKVVGDWIEFVAPLHVSSCFEAESACDYWSVLCSVMSIVWRNGVLRVCGSINVVGRRHFTVTEVAAVLYLGEDRGGRGVAFEARLVVLEVSVVSLVEEVLLVWVGMAIRPEGCTSMWR